MKPGKWLSSADRALQLAADRIRVIRAVTPRNATTERASLEQAFRRGSPRLPQWEYDRVPVPAELCQALDGLAEFLEGVSPLGRIYAGRAREMRLEAEIIDAVGTPYIRNPAARRFVGTSNEDRADSKKADELARLWSRPSAHEPELETNDDLVRSCDEADPRSLVSAMSREAGRCKLAMRVVIEPALASLAATGDGIIFVAAQQWMRARDVERTVLHEIAGHALPRARAASASLGIFALGTARGTDDQEGRALLIERASGFLDGPRRRELGLRHIGARATLDGGTFIDVVELLVSRQAPLSSAVRIASRVQRGGPGSGGLGREIIYIPSLLRVDRALSGTWGGQSIDDVMASGRIAADVAPLLSAAVAAEKTSPFPGEGDMIQGR